MRRAVILVFMCLTSIFGFCQSEEIGIFAGGSYYLGDLNPAKQFYNTNFAPGLLYRYNMKDNRWVLRIHFTYGTVEARDADSKIQSNIDRNLDFRSYIIEAGPIMELNFIEYEMGTRTNFGNKNRKSGTAYIFAGVNYFRMRPEGTLDNIMVELQPLGTEGQESSQNSDKRYNLNQISIPVGLGIKFNLGPRIACSFEYGLRKTFTDYLDDVSGTYVDPVTLALENGPIAAQMANKNADAIVLDGQQRGNPGTKDWYVFAGAILSYRLNKPGTCKKW